jgi:hypothetical protein
MSTTANPAATTATAHDPAAMRDPATVQDPAAVQDSAVAQNPAAVQDSVAVQDPATFQDPAAVQNPATVRNPVPEPVRIRAHHGVTRRLGHWTTERRLDILASKASIMLDLRSPRIEEGDIEIHLDIDHAAVKLLVSEGTVIDHAEVRRIGRYRVSNRPGTDAPSRRVVLLGEMRNAEIRVRRGGVATLSAMCTKEYLADARQARREGRYPTIDDPSR